MAHSSRWNNLKVQRCDESVTPVGKYVLKGKPGQRTDINSVPKSGDVNGLTDQNSLKDYRGGTIICVRVSSVGSLLNPYRKSKKRADKGRFRK